MKFKLSMNDYKFLEKYAIDAVILFDDITVIDDYCIFSVDYNKFLVELTYAVLDNGMDDEDSVNDIGKRLYTIVASITEQSKKPPE